MVFSNWSCPVTNHGAVSSPNEEAIHLDCFVWTALYNCIARGYFKFSRLHSTINDCSDLIAAFDGVFQQDWRDTFHATRYL